MTMIEFICYSKCTTCQKALAWLKESGVQYKVRDIKEDNPSYDELKKWYALSGLPLKKFFNTNGQLYRTMDLKNKLADMSEDEQLRLLSSDGMLVKRPIAVTDNAVLIGFAADKWAALTEV